MTKKNVLLLCGGGSSEHEISMVSSKYIAQNVMEIGLYNLIQVEIGAPKSSDRTMRLVESNQSGLVVEINSKGHLIGKNFDEEIHFVIPCIHGPPGETGEIQNFLEQQGLPYLGCKSEASQTCFNKITSKLWFNALQIPNTPFVFLTSPDDMQMARDLFKAHGKIFVKAASQGSSVGCYPVEKESDIESAINSAFKYSDYVLVEKMVSGRELEISTYEFNGNVEASIPGEIVVPNKFYSYEEKYSKTSKTETLIVAPNLTSEQTNLMRQYAISAFKGLKLRHLSRIDFFLTDDGEIYLNEINTFPGATPISMFPKMMENNKHSYKEFIANIIKENAL